MLFELLKGKEVSSIISFQRLALVSGAVKACIVWLSLIYFHINEEKSMGILFFLVHV
jgi:hypothetical protein